MDWESIKINYKEKLKLSCITFDSEEEYFFILGQFIAYVFKLLGGTHKYNSEFNYLTNPYIPKNMYGLGNRNIRFLKNINKKIKIKPYNIYKALLNNSHKFIKYDLNEKKCSDSFFHGLHSKNLFEDAENKG